jgi:hypothetical protein
MPRETHRTLTVALAVDAVASMRAISQVPQVQASYHSYEERTYGSRGPSDVTTAYVLTGAVTVGLNRWTLRIADLPKAATFASRQGQAVERVNVAVLETDLARAQKLAEALDVRLELVLSAAVCSGVAVLSGADVTEGPFEVAGVS